MPLSRPYSPINPRQRAGAGKGLALGSVLTWTAGGPGSPGRLRSDKRDLLLGPRAPSPARWANTKVLTTDFCATCGRGRPRSQKEVDHATRTDPLPVRANALSA